MNTESLRSVYQFTDYRLYLFEYYTLSKRNQKGFSYRSMARQLGFRSPNFLKLVIDGDRNIGKSSISDVCKGLGLRAREAEYFSYLVFFATSKNRVEKNYYFGLIAAMRSRSTIAQLNPEQFDYVRDWYIPVVRELVAGEKLPVDIENVASSLLPRVSTPKVKAAIDTLLRLGMLETDQDNVLVQTNKLVNTPNSLNSEAIRNYHRLVLGIAIDAIDKYEPSEREFGALTLKISRATFERIKGRLQELREEFLQIASDDSEASRVYQLNFNMYPVSHEKISYEK